MEIVELFDSLEYGPAPKHPMLPIRGWMSMIVSLNSLSITNG
jgi:hypothetical protein